MGRTIWAGAFAAALMVGTSVGAVRAATPGSAYLHPVAKSKTADWTMIAGKTNANGGENFDGYFKGAMVVTVPVGWTVKVLFKNNGSLPHSLVVEPWKENYNSPAPKPAFPGAETTNPIDGTAPGGKQTLSFRATKAGKYRVICAVPGHAALGMWDTLVVQKGLRTAVWGHAKPAPGKGGAKTHPSAHAARTVRSKFLTSIPARHLGVLKLLAGEGTVNGGENFDGYAKGGMTITIPLGWTVSVKFKNVGDLPHSAIVEPWNENYNSPSPKPAFAGAESVNPVDGTSPGNSSNFTFKVTKPGKYRVLCAVPGHAALGMWEVFIVKRGVKEASVRV